MIDLKLAHPMSEHHRLGEVEQLVGMIAQAGRSSLPRQPQCAEITTRRSAQPRQMRGQCSANARRDEIEGIRPLDPLPVVNDLEVGWPTGGGGEYRHTHGAQCSYFSLHKRVGRPGIFACQVCETHDVSVDDQWLFGKCESASPACVNA
ncbi:MAG: hypothetical protein WD118_03740 [Phycisphaeraceae bacterium]